MEVLGHIALALSESEDERHFPALFQELANILKSSQDPSILLESWNLGLPQLLTDTMRLEVHPNDIHAYACLSSLLVDVARFISSHNIPAKDCEV